MCDLGSTDPSAEEITASSRKRRSTEEESASSCESNSSAGRRSKKSRKNKKGKDHEKKRKKEKKKMKKKVKREKQDRDLGSSNPGWVENELDAKEIDDFKRAVQSRRRYGGLRESYSDSCSNKPSEAAASNSSYSTQDVFASSTDIASKYGISKGLIRTAQSNLSVSQEYSKSIFGGNDDNPATRQRLKREHTAQKAMKTARTVIAARQAAAAAAAKNQDGIPDVCNLSNTFRSSNHKQMPT